MASVEKAEAAGAKTQRERDYIAAVGKFYKESDKFDHGTRALAYEKAMAELQAEYPDDREAPISMRRLRVVPSLRSDNRLANAAALL